MNERILNLMGIARRAGRLSLGHDAVTEALRKGKTKLIVLAGDLSLRTAGGVRLAARKEEIETVQINATMDEISMALGKRTGVVAVNDQGFAKKLLSLIKTGSTEE